MAGIDTLIKGAVGSLAKDKVSPFLSANQRDFLSLVLNPQGYLLGTGIAAAANALGYGNEYKELKSGAEDQKAYEKEVVRDVIGDVLPESIGNFVRATPNTPYEPVGSYWDPEQNAFVNPNEKNLDPTGQRVNSSDEFREAMYGTITPNFPNFVGPQEFNSPADQLDMKYLAEDLGVPPTQQATGVNILDVLNAMNADGTINTDSQSFTGPQIEGSQLSENNAYDLGNSLSDYLSSTGGGGKFDGNNFEVANSMARGGFIYRGVR